MRDFTASWQLHSALYAMSAPVEKINLESPIFQGVVKDIRSGTLTPEDGAIIMLDMLGKSNYGNRRSDKRLKIE